MPETPCNTSCCSIGYLHCIHVVHWEAVYKLPRRCRPGSSAISGACATWPHDPGAWQGALSHMHWLCMPSFTCSCASFSRGHAYPQSAALPWPVSMGLTGSAPPTQGAEIQLPLKQVHKRRDCKHRQEMLEAECKHYPRSSSSTASQPLTGHHEHRRGCF